MEEEYSISVLQEQIPNYRNTKNPKKLRVAMLQMEDRDDAYFNWCMNINKAYCKEHDIDYIFLKNGPDDQPAYWSKVSVVLDIMNQGKHDIVVWQDSDSFVLKTKVDVREFFSSSSTHSMVIAGDPIGWSSPNFMAAVYMVKNNSIGREIFTKWMEYYDPKKWKKLPNGKWKYIGKGPWAGVDYEQGSFAKYILPRYKQYIKSVPWYVFHETNCKNPHADTWSIHIPGAIRTTRPYCVISEQTRRRFNRFNLTLFIIIILIIILILIIGLYIWTAS
jgi:predicted nucleic acid-binding Zn ribbon protein